MLNIEQVKYAADFDHEQAVRDVGTLDNVPDFALSTMSQLYNYLIRPFERSYGFIIHGPLDRTDDSMWGRHVHLPSGELMQLMFSPVCVLQDYYNGIAMISVRLTGSEGCNVKTCILFPPPTVPSPISTLLTCMCDPLGPKGLHLLLMSFFHQHNPSASRKNVASCSSWTIDPFGYGAVRSTTFSITNTVPTGCYNTCKKVRKNDFFCFLHSSSNVVSPGTSPFVIAAELVDCKMPDTERRACEPIHPKEYEKISERAISGICMGDNEIGKSALAASIAICDMLSGEGLISMLSNDFLKKCLPSKIKSPLGLGLVICIAVRIAMVPGVHGQRCGTVSDQVACAELRTLFESQLSPIPLFKNRCALDVILSLAQKAARERCSSNAQLFELQLNDQLVYWHRVGQGIISSLFGIWSSIDISLPTKHGSPWKHHDPLIAARDHTTVALGATFKDVRESQGINFTTVSRKRTTMIKLLIETEKYIRTGIFEGAQLADPNSKTEPSSLRTFDDATLNELFFNDRKSELEKGSKNIKMPSNDELQSTMFDHYCMAAVRQAQQDVSEMLFAGPAVHFKNKVGCYLVSDSQKSPCCDCKEPVHVLQGIVMAFAYGECPCCHAKRCLKCSSKYNFKDMVMAARKSASSTANYTTYGKACEMCGTEPPKIPVICK